MATGAICLSDISPDEMRARGGTAGHRSRVPMLAIRKRLRREARVDRGRGEVCVRGGDGSGGGVIEVYGGLGWGWGWERGAGGC